MNDYKQEINEIKEQIDSISVAAHELSEARCERREKRFVGIIVMLIAMLVITNGGWLWYVSQFEKVKETTTTITQDNDNGYNNYIGNDGDINNGETDDNNNDQRVLPQEK